MVVPEQPKELDDVKVIVNFLLYTSPPYVVDFGTIHRDVSMFAASLTVNVPARDEFVLEVVHNDSNVYQPGMLEAGE